jgi:hypothetical protein
LDEMFARNWFDKPLDNKDCRFVDVLTLKDIPIMQYDYYRDCGFKDAIEFAGYSTIRYLLRYPVHGDRITLQKKEVDFCDADKNVLVVGIYHQCHMPFLVAAKIKKALEGINGLSIKMVDYWTTTNPMFCEATINGTLAFDKFVFFMDDEQIRESVKAKMIRSGYPRHRRRRSLHILTGRWSPGYYILMRIPSPLSI